MTILTRVRNAWKRFRRRKCIKAVMLVESMNDVPPRVGSNLYLVYRGDQYRRAVLACPCRCGRRIDVSLSASHTPHWVVTRAGDEVTLSPSLWVPTELCGSHFFIRRNRIEWV